MSEEQAQYKTAAEPEAVVGQVQVELGDGAMLSVQMIRQVSPSCRAPVGITVSEAAIIQKALAGLKVGARP